MKILNALSPRGGEVQGTYGLFGFGTIEEELTYIAILSVILVILLICERWQRKLAEREEGLKDPIYDIGMFIKNMCKCWRKKQQQKGAGES